MSSYDVVVVGNEAGERCAGVSLREAGVSNIATVDRAVSSVFDDDTDTWSVKTREGQTYRARVVIATAELPLEPWIPDLVGRNDFRGKQFHSALWDRDFDPTGKHIAIVGADATTSQLIGELTGLAAGITVFCAGRRIVPHIGRSARATRWLRRRTTRSRVELVAEEIDAITASGVRTGDRDCPADAIIYATGLAVRDAIPDDTLVGAGGLTIQQAWQDGMQPYLGVAMHGFPNYFLVMGPDSDAQLGYIIDCLRLMDGGTRIEVRRSSEQVFNEYLHPERRVRRLIPSAFELSADDGDEIYDDIATLTVADTCHQVHVRLIGYFDPIDGQYHWRGTLFDPLPDDILSGTRRATLTLGERSASARITERTPQGGYSIAGVGEPPFAPSDAEAAVPRL